MTDNTSRARGQSLTPQYRAQEVADASVIEGYLAALATMVPSAATVMFLLKKYPNFAKKTNVQSRTALVIMPPCKLYFIAHEDQFTLYYFVKMQFLHSH